MQIIDKKFLKNSGRYVFQCSLATLSILCILIFIDAVTHSAIIASLGATAFIVFTRPKWYSSDPRRLFGGYLAGIGVGCLCSLLSQIPLLPFFSPSFRVHMILWGGIAVGLTIFLMVITDTEHPPAAGVALGLVIGEWNVFTLLYITCALLFMFVLKKIFYPLLIDLI